MVNMSKSILNNVELKTISDTISEIEKNTSGEICVVIKKRKSIFDFRKSVHEIAVNEFYKNKLDQTIDRSAVMLFILVKDHKFEILPDIGIQSKVAPFYWNVITETLSTKFSKNDFCTGICDFIKEIGIVLIKEFPRKQNDTNEISNEVKIS